MPNIGAPEVALLFFVALLLFGAKRLPELGRALGSGMREFKDSVTGRTEPQPEPPRAELPSASIAAETATPIVSTLEGEVV
jgi:sec-independent protein translocase protein TatA